MNAMADAEAILKKPLKTVMRNEDEFGSPTTFRALLFGALQEYHPETTLREVGRIISDVGVDEVEKSILAGLDIAFPDAKKKAKALKKKTTKTA